MGQQRVGHNVATSTVTLYLSGNRISASSVAQSRNLFVFDERGDIKAFRMVSCSDHMMDCGTVSQDGMFRLSPPHFGHNGYVTADLSCSPATAAQIHELQP